MLQSIIKKNWKVNQSPRGSVAVYETPGKPQSSGVVRSRQASLCEGCTEKLERSQLTSSSPLCWALRSFRPLLLDLLHGSLPNTILDVRRTDRKNDPEITQTRIHLRVRPSHLAFTSYPKANLERIAPRKKRFLHRSFVWQDTKERGKRE